MHLLFIKNFTTLELVNITVYYLTEDSLMLMVTSTDYW